MTSDDEDDGYAGSLRVMRDNGDTALADALESSLSKSGRPMKITIELATDEAIALRRFANETGEELDAAAHLAIREFLIGVGMLELPHELDEDTETAGEA